MATLSNPQVFGFSSPIGFHYKVNGDNVIANNKKDCAYRIRQLCNGKQITPEMRNILLAQLMALKRP